MMKKNVGNALDSDSSIVASNHSKNRQQRIEKYKILSCYMEAFSKEN